MKTIEEAASECYQNSEGDINHEYFKDIFKSGVEFAQRWIPVEEELPDEVCDVLAKKSNGKIVFMSFHAPFDSGKRIFQWWAFGKWINQNSQVTHWRPIEIL